MDRATNEIFPPQERSRTGGLQRETEHAGPSSQSTPVIGNSTGDRLSAPGGTVNKSTGTGNHFTGAKFSGPYGSGTKEHFDPLQECLRSLAFPEMDSRLNDIDAAAQGTCDWLLLHKTYKSWTSCDRGLLWIKGKPGSGKSTLLRYVLEHAMTIPNIGEGALILSFFFHGRGSELQKTPLGLFRSLLHQLLRQVPEALTDLVATFQQRCESIGKPGEKWQWHPRELQRFLEPSLRKVLEARTVWLFVDALDECGKENAVNLAEYFKPLLPRLPPSGLKQSRICFTCRHYPILDLDCVFEICVEKENRKDISTFVQDKLSSIRGRTSSTIRDLVTNRANGVFMWAWLVMKQVLELQREGAGLTGIKAAILSVPQELDNLYRELIRNLGPDSLKLIQWICFATRPLSLDELRWALVIEVDCPHQSLYECQNAGDYTSDDERMQRRVQTLSRGLAEVTSDGKVVQFIHQSVKDFFVEKGLSALDENAKTDLMVGIAHHRLSRTCIRYLAMEEIGRSAGHEPYGLRSKFPFLHYATTSWVAHMRQSDARSVPQEDLLAYFTGPSNTLMERWVHIYRILERYSNDCPPEGTSLVHVVSRYGVAGALGAILGRADEVGINIDAKDSDGRTPLSWAAGGGHEVVVQILLKTGKFDVVRWPKVVLRLLLLVTGKVNIDTKDRKGRTPLSWAASNRHEGIVRLLLDRGAHTEAVDKDGWTPLWWAAANGHEAVMRLLLDRGAHAEAADKDGRTLLLWAAENGHEAVVRLLLDRGAHTEAADKDGWTPLWWAVANRQEAVVRLLLDGGAHTEAADKIWGRTPLSWAAAGRHEGVVQLLLDRGAHTEAADKDGWTPLSWAVANRQEAVVRLLLDRGAHIEAADEDGRTLLLWAARNGHEAFVQLLLDRGAHAEAADRWGRTPLSWAAENGHEAVMRLLLDRGAHAEAADMWGRTPLSWAAEIGREAIVQLLFEQGAHTDAADEDGRTPLWWAAWNGSEAVVQLLLAWGAHTGGADRDGRPPPSWAAANGHEAVIRLLLDGGAHIEAPDKDGRTLLLWAAGNGHEAVVRLLLGRGARAEAADKDGRTPLWWAAWNRHQAVVRLLQVHIAQPSSTTLP